MQIVLDTSVIIDMFLLSRSRHADAATLANYLRAEGKIVKEPMHAYFELASAWNSERKQGGKIQHSHLFTRDTPLPIQFVPIDEAFCRKYHDTELPYLRAGDLIFLALAKGDGAVLITEDRDLYRAAQESKVEVRTISEFIEKYVVKPRLNTKGET